MTPESTLKAAAAALRREPEPTRLHTALVAWLDDTAEDAANQSLTWRDCGFDVDEVSEANYRFPPAVARAVLEERDGS